MLLIGSTAFAQGMIFGYLEVSSSVLPECSVSTSPVNFGPYTMAEIDQEGGIVVKCSIQIPYVIKLGTGNSGYYFPRQMSGGWPLNPTLNYNLYTDLTRTTIWGDGSAGTGTVSGIGTGSPILHVVYGRLFANQIAPSGTYFDLVEVQVEY